MLEVRYIYDVNNKPVNEYTIKNGSYQLSVINLGATITKMIVPNENNKLENITLRYYDYKFYKENPYYLGCLIDVDKFIQKKPCCINYYFNCTILYHALIFTYKENNHYIIIKYSLEDNQVLIEYDTNLPINLSHVLFFNLSGNVKFDILNHDLKIGSKEIDLKQDISYFKHYNNDDEDELLHLSYKENEIKMKVFSFNRDIYLSFGKYFNKEFYINKKNIGEQFSGIGIVICGELNNQLVNYQFL